MSFGYSTGGNRNILHAANIDIDYLFRSTDTLTIRASCKGIQIGLIQWIWRIVDIVLVRELLESFTVVGDVGTSWKGSLISTPGLTSSKSKWLLTES